MTINRYTFREKDWPAAIEYIKKGIKTVDTPNWSVKFKDNLKLKGKQIYYDNKKIIPTEQVEKFLRNKIYDKSATIPFGRDSAHYKLKSEVVGVPRRRIMEFIRAQKSLGQVRSAVAQPKVKSGKKLKGVVLETDLVFLKREDVKKMNTRIGNSLEKELSYICVTVEKNTGLVQCTYIKAPKGYKSHEEIKLKGSKIVTPIVKKHIQYFAKALKTNAKQIHLELDKGGEFNRKELAKILKSVKVVPMGSSVEKKNQTIQRNLFRILKNRQAKTISEAVTKSQNMANNTFNKIQKKTPLEAADIGIKAALNNYNKTRKTYVQGDKRGELKIGDHVRILIKKPKAGIDFKSYKDMTYTSEVYAITSKTKKKPAKYRVNKKYYTIDKLLKSAPRDKESEKLIKDRKVEEVQEDIDEREKQAEDDEKRKEVQVAAGSRRSTRGSRAGRALKRKFAQLRDKHEKKVFGEEDE